MITMTNFIIAGTLIPAMMVGAIAYTWTVKVKVTRGVSGEAARRLLWQKALKFFGL